MISFKTYINESNQVRINGKLVTITIPDRAKGDKLVAINTAKFDEAFKNNPTYYIGKGGIGSIKDRYKNFELFVIGGKQELAPGVVIDNHPTKSIEASEVSVDENGNVMFINGRHRYAWMRDHGIDNILVAMDKLSIKNAKTHKLIKEN
jgi:hypothetical protein